MRNAIVRLHSSALALMAACGLLMACGPDKTPPAVSTRPIPLSEAAQDKSAPRTVEERARELTQKLLIVDGHIDLPFRLEMGRDEAGAVSEDVSKRTNEGDFDWARARAGGLDAPFMSIYVPAKHQKEGGAKALADRLIDIVEGIAKAHPDKFSIPHSIVDVAAGFKEKKVLLPMGIENGAALEGKLENVEYFHERGIRYITLTHSEDNDICDSSYAETRTHKGLSAFGRKVVAEMNRVGVMVDVSHISDDAFWQVMDATDVPAIASHSSCRHFTPGFERNMSDEMIKRLAEEGGVVMVNYGSTFITKEAREWSQSTSDAREAFMAEQGITSRADPKVKAWYAEYKKQHPLPFANVKDVADHILHVVELVGVDHVGLGSDFDGVGDSLPVGLKDPSHLPNLFAELLRRGASEADLAKIAGLNVLRVWATVERTAARRQKESAN